MDPLSEYLEILRKLTPRTRELLEALRNQLGTVGTFTPKEFAKLIGSILVLSEERALVERALVLLVRLRVITPQILTRAIEFATASTAEGGTVVIAGGGAEGGAAGVGAVGGGVSLALVASVLIALLSVAFAVYSIATELTTDLELPDEGGSVCSLTTPQGIQMATKSRKATVRAIGTRTSLNQAIEAADEMCKLDSSKCTDSCPEGKECLPTAAVQSTEQSYRVVYTKTDLTFTCPCTCQSSETQ